MMCFDVGGGGSSTSAQLPWLSLQSNPSLHWLPCWRPTLVASGFLLPIHPGRFPDGKSAALLKPTVQQNRHHTALHNSTRGQRTQVTLKDTNCAKMKKASSGLLDVLLHSPVCHQVSLPSVAKTLTLTSNRNGLLSYFAFWVRCMWVTCKDVSVCGARTHALDVHTIYIYQGCIRTGG